MNLVEELMQADPSKASEKKKGVFKSKRLMSILGKDEPVDVEIVELPFRALNSTTTSIISKSGTVDYTKLYDTQIKVICKSVTNIDLKDMELCKKFGCATKYELVELLFGSEVPALYDAITDLSEIPDEEEEIETIKN